MKIPITILTGFLGSGKTTLLNRVLSHPERQRYAVIENEFSSIGIDQDLIAYRDDDILETQNGCICCQAKDDLLRTLLRLSLMKDRFDRIILETTGLADPTNINSVLYFSPKLKEHFYLDGTVTLVDALNVSHQLAADPSCESQIAGADLIIVNKLDLLEEDDLEVVEAKIRNHNSHAPIRLARYSDIPLEEIFNASAHSMGKKFRRVPSPNSLLLMPKKGSAKPEVHQHDRIASFAVEVKGSVRRDRFLKAMRLVRTQYGPNLFRFKGFIRCDDSDTPLLVQGAMHHFEPLEPVSQDLKEKTFLIFIGIGLDESWVRSTLSPDNLSGEATKEPIP